LKTGWKRAEAVIDNLLRYVDVFNFLLVYGLFEIKHYLFIAAY
jgi:hypothetical protein